MIETILRENQGFTLLIAPPAWGKTQILKKLFQAKNQCFLFVSPLRALANEFYENIKEQFKVINIEQNSDWKKIDESFPSIIIVTPELINDLQISKLEKLNLTIILDEFHLYFYWGTTFREEMWHIMIDLFSLGRENKKIIGLTATMSDENTKMLREQFLNCDLSITILNLGNQQLKNLPSKIIYLPSFCKKSWELFVHKKKEEIVLVFCQYRKQVNQIEKNYEKKGYKVLTCLGGEAGLFAEKLKKEPYPDLIISTTVLSHGVNLPPLSRVIFTYPVKNMDFWIQMVGRGGRKGESFVVITYDDFKLNRWLKLCSFFTILMRFVIFHLTWDDDI